MRAKYHFKSQTQPDEEIDLSNKPTNQPIHLTVKDIQFNEQKHYRKNPKEGYFMMGDRRLKPLPVKFHHKRHEINSKINILTQNQQSFQEQVQEKNKQNKKNVNLLNALIQILKPSQSVNKKPQRIGQKQKPKKIPHLNLNNSHNKMQDYKQKFLGQFFQNGSLNSTKNYRRPRIVQNQMTKIYYGNQLVNRRKIVSEEKNRPKYNLEEKKDKNIEGIQILTFSNKFPGINKQIKNQSFQVQRFNNFQQFSRYKNR